MLQFDEFSCGSFDKNSITKYTAYLRSKFTPKTAKRKIAALKVFTHYLMMQEIIDANPFDKIDTSFREPMVLPKVIPMNIIGKILKNAYADFQKSEIDFSRKKAIRNIAILEMLFVTGVRVSEICTLTLVDVDLINRTIKIFGKESKE